MMSPPILPPVPATRYCIKVTYPTGDVRYVTETGALSSDIKAALRYKSVREANDDAKTLGATASVDVA